MRGRFAALRVPFAALLALALAPLAPAAEPDASIDPERLREQLTEREDENRVEDPWTTQLGGHPLTVSGEYELALEGLRAQRQRGATVDGDRLLLEQELEVELFYTLGEPLSFFAQLRPRMEEDLDPDTDPSDEVSAQYVERGEAWISSERVGGSDLSFDAGRLDFEDDRLWWWDADLDAARVIYETRAETFEIALAVARELAPARSDWSFVEPDAERVLRFVGELSWDYQRHHGLQLFALRHIDRSDTETPGRVLKREREDDSDARLLWLGARASGAWLSKPLGILGYWVDLGYVRGEEDALEFEDVSDDRVQVEERFSRDVRGGALDLGLTWILPRARDPRFTLGYARSSRDSEPESGTDRTYRQSGIHANEPGFGGVERFALYGLLLEPELSNLEIYTLGAGITLFGTSSLDLVYHHYRLIEPATGLRDTRLEMELTGADRDLGDELDLVIALEEWEHLELLGVASAFRAGRAFGDGGGDWAYGGLLEVRWAF